MESTTLKTILIVDDAAIVSTLLSDTLRSRGFNTLTAISALEARQQLEANTVDIAIIDLDLGSGPSGIDLAYFLESYYPDITRVALTKFPDLARSGHSTSSLPAQTALLAKEDVSNIDALLRTIDEATAGKIPATTSRLEGPLGELSTGQLAILRMLAQGYTIAEMANKRERSTSAIEKSITKIYKKLGFDDAKSTNPRTMAVRMYVDQLGLPGRPNGTPLTNLDDVEGTPSVE